MQINSVKLSEEDHCQYNTKSLLKLLVNKEGLDHEENIEN